MASIVKIILCVVSIYIITAVSFPISITAVEDIQKNHQLSTPKQHLESNILRQYETNNSASRNKEEKDSLHNEVNTEEEDDKDVELGIGNSSDAFIHLQKQNTDANLAKELIINSKTINKILQNVDDSVIPVKIQIPIQQVYISTVGLKKDTLNSTTNDRDIVYNVKRDYENSETTKEENINIVDSKNHRSTAKYSDDIRLSTGINYGLNKKAGEVRNKSIPLDDCVYEDDVDVGQSNYETDMIKAVFNRDISLHNTTYIAVDKRHLENYSKKSDYIERVQHDIPNIRDPLSRLPFMEDEMQIGIKTIEKLPSLNTPENTQSLNKGNDPKHKRNDERLTIDHSICDKYHCQNVTSNMNANNEEPLEKKYITKNHIEAVITVNDYTEPTPYADDINYIRGTDSDLRKIFGEPDIINYNSENNYEIKHDVERPDKLLLTQSKELIQSVIQNYSPEFTENINVVSNIANIHNISFTLGDPHSIGFNEGQTHIHKEFNESKNPLKSNDEYSETPDLVDIPAHKRQISTKNESFSETISTFNFTDKRAAVREEKQKNNISEFTIEEEYASNIIGASLISEVEKVPIDISKYRKNGLSEDSTEKLIEVIEESEKKRKAPLQMQLPEEKLNIEVDESLVKGEFQKKDKMIEETSTKNKEYPVEDIKLLSSNDVNIDLLSPYPVQEEETKNVREPPIEILLAKEELHVEREEENYDILGRAKPISGENYKTPWSCTPAEIDMFKDSFYHDELESEFYIACLGRDIFIANENSEYDEIQKLDNNKPDLIISHISPDPAANDMISRVKAVLPAENGNIPNTLNTIIIPDNVKNDDALAKFPVTPVRPIPNLRRQNFPNYFRLLPINFQRLFLRNQSQSSEANIFNRRQTISWFDIMHDLFRLNAPKQGIPRPLIANNNQINQVVPMNPLNELQADLPRNIGLANNREPQNSNIPKSPSLNKNPRSANLISSNLPSSQSMNVDATRVFPGTQNNNVGSSSEIISSPPSIGYIHPDLNQNIRRYPILPTRSQEASQNFNSGILGRFGTGVMRGIDGIFRGFRNGQSTNFR